MTESLKRGQNRSWYVGEEDWIKSTDELDSTFQPSGTATSMQRSNTGTNTTSGGGVSPSGDSLEARKKAAKEQYIPVPNDPSSSNLTCPVCKEKFETSWHADAEEWVWMDAMKVDQKVYHASCYTESGGTKGGAGEGKPTGAGATGKSSRDATPDLNFGDIAAILRSVKRKAEVCFYFVFS